MTPGFHRQYSSLRMNGRSRDQGCRSCGCRRVRRLPLRSIPGEAARADRHRRHRPRSAAARPVVAERIDALPGQFDAHLVGQHGQRHEEVGRGAERIGHEASRVAIPLERPVLEVERLVAVAGRLPGEHRRGEPPRLERLPLQPALARIVVARSPPHADVEVDVGQPVAPQPAQRLTAVTCRLATVVARGRRVVADRGLQERDGLGRLLRLASIGHRSRGLGPALLRHLVFRGYPRRNGQIADVSRLGHCGQRDGRQRQGDRRRIAAVTPRASRAPQCSSGLRA